MEKKKYTLTVTEENDGYSITETNDFTDTTVISFLSQALFRRNTIILTEVNKNEKKQENKG